ncbi:1-deoxy-D-xylulose-5-phosphate synthase [Pseudomonas synxantha]|uniref:1-deoxy-D-xylulose-5-phosphate synthase n=1 Tax=Pseudomonas synxantha TaxID=47883 RepID=A0AAX3I4S9_9PSED|nr:1-deoxy-D-xylulose-5-phosphate synthase [Pseudomonas synxantha]AZE67935.1 1-deoxy-D-xylulose 5-phosphate synthase [Pseudomonas synxantha]KRP47668.1 1-deoxy-D-xylulose-5-phosphate synthase [Pseudomonas synxantha]MDQ0981826.1 1-deoxy-D-xylulose-5-phosphate synthase [Pseudomonas synxantha]SDU15991.1 1-deoxy-D-xylulose-5-phosphate synthase [Pseudomonas synxantha]VTQ97021.1 1-deoxy-D-xylulose-5-phosphate synthase [Pseudomonas synxantha]
MFELLNTIDNPVDLRALHSGALAPLADELRAFILHSVSRTGGHLSANLGTVELSIALHYVFDTPKDRIVWDVGHQAYAHKILTGRREAMASIRQFGGISGFPRRSESSYDAFGTAHASTSISAALGMALAARLKGEHRHCVAVVGDGALSGGMAFEAMNNAGLYSDLPLLVILNDNDISISPSVGALRYHLGELKELVAPASLFETLGFNYTGPINGHDLNELVSALSAVRNLRGSQLLHIITEKGHGYSPAATDPVLYHGTGKFEPTQGILPTMPGKPTYTQIFGQWLCDEAENDPRVVAITPAMREGSGLVEFERRFPNRYFDVGIAEQHALTFAAGLASEGLKPVVAIYSSFLQRAYDQLIHDIAIQNLPVVFAIDRAGIVGADGATHNGAFDIAYLRCVPNLTIMCPADENECRQMLHTALLQNGPTAVRYPRGKGNSVAALSALPPLPIGRGEVRRTSNQPAGDRIAILAFGSMVLPALESGEALDATVANMRFIKPLDGALIEELARTHDLLVTIEEGCVMGGVGSACLEHLAAIFGLSRPTLQLGFTDEFIEHGRPEELLGACGLDAAGITSSIQTFLARQSLEVPLNGSASHADVLRAQA